MTRKARTVPARPANTPEVRADTVAPDSVVRASPLKFWIGIITAAALSLLGSMDFYQLAAEARKHSPDPYLVETQLPRYEPIKQVAGVGVRLGYVSNLGMESTRGSMMFYLAQYALAPRMVLSKPAGEWVLGNFTEKLDYAAKGQELGLTVARDFGDGLILYRANKGKAK